MYRVRVILLIMAIASAIAMNTRAQTPQGPLTVSLLTCAPGSEIYELEGHTGLRFRDNHGFDMTANWGVFDFNSPGFVYRFVKGETDYMVAMYPTQLFLDQYRRENRLVSEQILNLDSLQSTEAFRLVTQNLMPQNRTYRYNYVLDNCATRPLAIIEKSAGTITLGRPGINTDLPATFRKTMKHYHVNYPWYQFGIDLALGSKIDAAISQRAISFSPHALNRMLAGAKLSNGQPAVIQQNKLTPGTEQGTSKPPTPWPLTPMAAALLILLIAIAVTFRDICRRRCSSIFDTIFFTILGLTGCVLAYLAFISVHHAASPNFNLLWLNPLLLLIPIFSYTPLRRAVPWLQMFNLSGIALFATIWILQIQIGNPAFIPLLSASAIRALARIIIPCK